MGKTNSKASKLEAIAKSKRFKVYALKRPSVNEVRQTALYLASLFDDDRSIKFYLKCAWRLPKDYLIELADRAREKDTPKYYFYAAASRELHSQDG